MYTIGEIMFFRNKLNKKNIVGNISNYFIVILR